MVTQSGTGNRRRPRADLRDGNGANGGLRPGSIALSLDDQREALLQADTTGRIVFANRAARDLLGYSKAELVGMRVEILAPRRYRAASCRAWDTFLRRAPRERGGSRGEFIARRKDGSEVDVEVRVRPITSADGQTVLITLLDLSARHRAEQARSEQLYHLETLRQISHSILAGETMEETAAAAAERLREALGCSRVGVLSVSPVEGSMRILAVAGAAAALTPIGVTVPVLRDFVDAKPVNGQFVFRRLTSRSKYQLLRLAYAAGLRSVIAVPMSREGEAIGLLTAWSDRFDGFSEASAATVRETADQLALALDKASLVEQLRLQNAEQEQRNAVLQDYASRLERLHELDRSIHRGATMEEVAEIAANHLLVTLGCRRVSVIRMSDKAPGNLTLLATAGVGEDVRPKGSEFSLVEEGFLVSSVEEDYAVVRIRGRGRTPLLKALYALGLRSFAGFTLSHEGERAGLLTIWSDRPDGISERDRSIAGEVADRLSAALAQVQLLEQIQRQNAELEKGNEDLRAVVYSTTHDLQAPLRAMRGFGEALMEDYGATLPDPARDFINRIVDGSSQMDGLIKDILSYWQVTRAEFQSSPASLLDIVRAALDQLQAEVRASGARITLGKKDEMVLAYEPALLQVIANLISNAIKFVRPGETPAVSIRVWSNGRFVRLCVKDNGVGIPAEYSERIFTLFERLYSRERYPGTGIGLALVRRSIERMGGRVGLKSSPGEGSTFWFDLPRA